MKEELYNTLKKAIIEIKKQHNDPDYRVKDHWWEQNTTTSRYRNGRNGEDEIFEYIMDKDIFNYDYDFLGYLVAFIYWKNDTDSVNIEVTKIGIYMMILVLFTIPPNGRWKKC